MDIGFFARHKHFITHAKCLYSSLKKHIKDCEVTIVVTKKDYQAFNLSFNHCDLNILTISNTTSYPFVDKMKAASIFEKKVKGEMLWVDIHSYFLQNIDFKSEHYIRVNPVDIKNIGINHGATVSKLWEIVSEYMNIDYRSYPPVLTVMLSEPIYPYFNAGCVYIKENLGLFGKTYTTIIELLHNKKLNDILEETISNQIFFHQVVFTLALLRLYKQNTIGHLPEGVNIPIHVMKKYNTPIDFTKIKSLRYDNYFDDGIVDSNLPIDLFNHKDKLNMLWD